MICSHYCLPTWTNFFSASPLTASVVLRWILLILTEKILRSKSLRKSFPFISNPSYSSSDLHSNTSLFHLVNYRTCELALVLECVSCRHIFLYLSNSWIVRLGLNCSLTHFSMSVLLNLDMATHLIKLYILREQR